MTEPTSLTIPRPIETVVDDHLVLTCQVQNCLKMIRYGEGFEGSEGFEKARESFRRHLAQHEPGRTPDVWMTLTCSWACSVCNKRITVEDLDPDEERLWCWNCGASWDTEDTDGRTDIANPDD